MRVILSDRREIESGHFYYWMAFKVYEALFVE